VRVEIGLHRSFVAFLVFMGITIDPLRNVFLGIVCKQAHYWHTAEVSNKSERFSARRAA